MALAGEVLEVAIRAAVLDVSAETDRTLHRLPCVVLHLRDQDFRLRPRIDDPPLRLATSQAARHFPVAFHPVSRTTGRSHPPLARHFHASLVSLRALERFFSVVLKRGIRKRQTRIWIRRNATGATACGR